MNTAVHKLSFPKTTTAILLSLLFLSAITPVPSWAIDGRRTAAGEQERLEPDARQPAVRDRGGSRLQLHSHPAVRWTLGVQVDNLQTGTRITHVLPSSAAWRAGLERTDVIVSVNGYQIGYVMRQLYDLPTELNLRADRNGWVRLLVWNHRNGELVNVDVELDRSRPPHPTPHHGGIRGTVAFEYVVADGKNAEVVVELVDITNRFANKTICEQRIDCGEPAPVAFQLDFDPSQLADHRRYQLQAQLYVEGRRVLASRPGLYLLNKDNVDVFQIELEPLRLDRR